MQEDGDLLGHLGLDADQQRVYLAFLRAPRRPVAPDDADTGLPPAHLRAVITDLERRGLLTALIEPPGTFTPASPDIAIDMLVAERQQALEQAKLLGRRLLAEYHSGPRDTSADGLVEVWPGSSACHQIDMLLYSAREIRVMDTPPYETATPFADPLARKLMGQGLVMRSVYAPACLEIPGAREAIGEKVADGEQARVGEVPFKLFLADTTAAVIWLEYGRACGSSLVIRPSTFLTALVDLYEDVWRRAAPLELAAGRASHEEEERRILELLSRGLKDEAIARQLGLSPRTVFRRVSQLMQRLGARTRFEAGVLAAQRGLL